MGDLAWANPKVPGLGQALVLYGFVDLWGVLALPPQLLVVLQPQSARRRLVVVRPRPVTPALHISKRSGLYCAQSMGLIATDNMDLARCGASVGSTYCKT